MQQVEAVSANEVSLTSSSRVLGRHPGRFHVDRVLRGRASLRRAADGCEALAAGLRRLRNGLEHEFTLLPGAPSGLAYWYAHVTTNRSGSRWQPRLHLPLLLLPAVAAAGRLACQRPRPAEDSSPVLWLLRTLLLMIGLPFAVVATTGPLLQRWYSWTDHERSEDPYFLFAASNLGSFGGLLAYPLLIEPRVSLADQRTLWSWGFVIFAVLCALSAIIAGSAPRRGASTRDANTRCAVPDIDSRRRQSSAGRSWRSSLRR